MINVNADCAPSCISRSARNEPQHVELSLSATVDAPLFRGMRRGVRTGALLKTAKNVNGAVRHPAAVDAIASGGTVIRGRTLS